MLQGLTVSRCLSLLLCAAMLSACSSGGGPSASSVGAPPVQGAPSPTPSSQTNAAPAISGNPQTSVNAGASYVFTPTAADVNGDSLTFGVAGLPSWASFSSTTGSVEGAPSEADVGTYRNIIVQVSDGKAAASLSPFAITVSQMSMGSATLTWMPPTENTDGSALKDLAGYWIYFGTNAADLAQKVRINNASISRYFIDNLSAGKWYFGVSTFNRKGIESVLSSLSSKTIG